ncbi:serine protease [Hyalangium gracile]|uniref:serine protease n=1 Tax=Hyalangium gracile TaxID=394092 RepID=UPI001CCDDD10|nr:serine protease [Hyalangium gracile]
MNRIRLACLLAVLPLAAQASPNPSSNVCEASQPSASSQRLTKVGEDVYQRFESAHPYASRDVSARGLVRTDVLHHPGAAYIAPHFERLELEEGDFVVVRAPDNSRSWRYDNSHPGARDGFWAIHIAGDTAIVELHSQDHSGRRGILNKHGYTIDRFARGYTNTEMGIEPRALCGADDSQWAPCYASSDPAIYGRARPVARLLINGSGACTGWLVGSQGHLMTNNHCIDTAATAQNTSYEFMAEGSSCSTSCASWFGCPGTIIATSATLVKTDAPRDYTLVQLPTNPINTYGYLQLRGTGAVVNERIFIPQHPAGYGKKIAVRSTHANDQSGFAEIYSLNEAACQSGGPSDVGYFADTQGGSSGSPVLGHSDNLVVALHHCANCANRGVPIQSVISHLGSSLPTCALPGANCPDSNGDGSPPPPPPPPPPNSYSYNATNTNSAQQSTVNKVVALTAGQKITVGTCGLTGATVSGDSYLRLFGPSATQVAANDDACGGSGSSLTFTAATAGNYEIRAGCYNNTSCGGTVVWDIVDGQPPPTGNTYTYSATNTNSAQQSTVNQSVTLAAGQKITLGTCGLAGATFTGDTYLRLYSPANAQVASNDDACSGRGSSLSFTATTAGTYQIRAGCYSNTSCTGTVAWTIQ